MTINIFHNFPDAFDYCRECDKPVTVYLTGNLVWRKYVLFPSGRAEFIEAISHLELKESGIDVTGATDD